MQVNTSKTKVMIFTLKRKKVSREFVFKGNPLPLANEYKYIGLDFHTQGIHWGRNTIPRGFILGDIY